MDLDLKPGWEKKALIILGITVFIILIYAFNPFGSNADVYTAPDQTQDVQPVTSAPSPVVSNASDNNTTVNTTSNNSTFQISADVAKNIATGANPGYTAGQPTPGNVTINSTMFSVWIVPITQGSLSKNIYIDMSNGTIVGSA